MLTFTSAQLRDYAIKGDLGQPITLSNKREQSDAATIAGTELYTVPRGFVALVTSITSQAGSNKRGISGGVQPSPPHSGTGISVINEDSDTWGLAQFLTFRRLETFFMGTSTPTSRAAPPGNVALWQLKHPIAIPPGCTIDLGGTTGEWGNHAAVEFMLVPEGHARSLGYNVNVDPDKSRTVLQSKLATSAEQVLVAGRPGKHIRLMDLNIRLQPATAGPNVLRIYQDDGSTERDIAIFVNDNPVDSLPISFSPDDVFLKAGADLKVQTTISNSASVNVYAEHCDGSEVDSQVFWCCVQPSKPGTSATAVVTALLEADARKIASELSLYYPKLDITKTEPGRGHQHLVRGVVVSVQKGAGVYDSTLATRVVEQTLFTISHGASSGEIGFSAVVPTENQTNQQIIPTLYATEHDQNVLLVDDKKNAACKPDDGSLWINALNLRRADSDDVGAGAGVGTIFAAVETADADITAWAFAVWGRTIPTRFRAPSTDADAA